MDSTRKFLTVLLALSPCMLASGGPDQSAEDPASGDANKTWSIGLVYTAPHTVINQAAEGFKKQIRSEAPSDVVLNIIEKHASGDVTQYGSIVDAVLSREVDLVVSITTPVSQKALKRIPEAVPLCFLAVTDPVGAGLVDSIDKPAKCTGVSDLAPFASTLRFMRAVMPTAKTIGFPYNPNEQPAVYGYKECTRLAPRFGFELVGKAITSEDDKALLFQELARSCDCLLIGSDNLMFESAPTLVKAGLLANTPTFASDTTSIKAGAVGGYSIDYVQVGVEGAKLAGRILRGEKAGQIPVTVLTSGIFEINRKAASTFDIAIPEDLARAAANIYPSP